MKVLVSLVFCLTFILINTALADKVNCKVVPFETKDGISGTCCVFYRNVSNRNDPGVLKEEIARQILENKNKEDSLTFPAAASSGTSETQDDKEKVVVEDNKAIQMRGSPQVNEESKNNITFKNKNAFDTPSICPKGTMMDHNGDCIEPF